MHDFHQHGGHRRIKPGRPPETMGHFIFDYPSVPIEEEFE
jgi:hypothetical protein